MLARLVGGLDRALPVPLGVQLAGLIQYGIALGDLAEGIRLPTVRDMADQAGIAPMTVVGVYNDLKRQRLIETRGSAGTFVAASGQLPALGDLARLKPALDGLLRVGQEMGLGPAELATLLNVRSQQLRASAASGLRLVLVGHFEKASAAYADDIRPLLPLGDKLAWTTLSALQAVDTPPPADLVLTIPSRRAEVEAVYGPDIPVLGINFLPSADTRARLAAISPQAHVAIVSVFPEFMALMKAGVGRFAPPTVTLAAVMADDDRLNDTLSKAETIVFATGLDGVVERLGAEKRAIEYRHVPDTVFIQQQVLPRLEALRQASSGEEAHENCRDELVSGGSLSQDR